MKTTSTPQKKHLTFVRVNGWQAFILFYENKLLPLEETEEENKNDIKKTPPLPYSGMF